MNPRIEKDPKALTMTVVAELDASVERAWQLVADPRQLERWWGPPTYPATVVDHDLTPGGKVSYFMTGPDGDKSAGYWEVLSVDPPHALEVRDGFADDSGQPNESMPAMTMAWTFEATATGSVMRVQTRFPSVEAMDQLLSMGMEEGITAAAGQIDAILAEDTAA